MAEPATQTGEPAGSPDGNGDWRASLPEDLRDAPVFQDIKDIGTLAKNYSELKTYQGQSIRIPGEDAGEETLQKFYSKLGEKVPGLIPTPDPDNDEQMNLIYTRLGRPEDATGYEIPKVDSGDIPVDFSMAEALKPIAHKYGLSNKQFKGIVAEMTAGNVAIAQQQMTEHAQSIAELSREWGAAYTERINKAAKVAQATGAPPDLINAVRNGHAGAQTLKWLYSLSQSLGGETANLIKQQGIPTMTPDDAQMAISEIRNNKKHPYWDASDPGHAAARKKMRELHKLAFPGDGPVGVNAGVGGLM